MLEVNGKHYPLWSQFVERKAEYIGKTMESHDMGSIVSTVVTDVELIPNGDDSAFFRFKGKDFDCGFDVKYGGIAPSSKGWLTFSMMYGGEFMVKL